MMTMGEGWIEHGGERLSDNGRRNRVIRGNGGRDGVIMGEGTEWLWDEGQSYHGKRDGGRQERE